MNFSSARQHIGFELDQRGEVDFAFELQIVGQGKVDGAFPEPAQQVGLVALADVDLHPGVRLHEAVAQPRDDDWRQRHEAADVDRAEYLVGKLAGETLQLVGVTQQRLGLFQDLAAGRGQAHALRVMPDEQLDLEHVLEMRDRIRNRRLRYVDILGRAQDAAGLAGGDEISQLLQRELHGQSASPPGITAMTSISISHSGCPSPATTSPVEIG